MALRLYLRLDENKGSGQVMMPGTEPATGSSQYVLTEQFSVFAPRLAVGKKPDAIAEKRLTSLIRR